MDEFLTPIFRFPADSAYHNIVLKREDLSETGSHKFRYLKHQMEEFKKQGINRVVLSTTGNVGITASHYGKKLGIQVLCFMSDRGDASRAAQIEEEGGLLVISSRPKRFAEYVSKKYHIPLLRASQEEASLQGYKSLGEEILREVPDADAIINFATSGTSSVGLMQAYAGHKLPALIIVQDHDHQIVRHEELDDLVRLTHGSYHSISAADLARAGHILQGYNLETSYEGVSCFAVALNLRDQYRNLVVILSGKKWPEKSMTSASRADTLQEIDTLWSKWNS